VSEAARNELEALPDAAKAELMSAAAKVFTPEAPCVGMGMESSSGMTPQQALLAAVEAAVATATNEGVSAKGFRALLEKVAASVHDAASAVPAELRDVHDKAETALADLKKQRQATGSSKHEAKLPDALRNFMPLAKEPEVKAAMERLDELEFNVARSPSSRDAQAVLRTAHTRLASVLKRKIAERTTEADATRLVKECQAAIAAGNRDFMIVYDGVWKIIASGETRGRGRRRRRLARARISRTLIQNLRVRPARRNLAGICGLRRDLRSSLSVSWAVTQTPQRNGPQRYGFTAT
jgi:hypothetical protein